MTREYRHPLHWAVALSLVAQVFAQAPGLHLTLVDRDAVGGAVRTDHARVRALALCVEDGAPASPFLAAPNVRAQWSGQLAVPERDRYRFTFVGAGKLTLRVGDAVVLACEGDGRAPVTGEPVRLAEGKHVLVATYENAPGRPALVRVEWEGRRFAREPIPPTSLTCDQNDADLVRGEAARAGRMLLATRRCTACHVAPAAATGGAMPELAMRGPRLDGVGARVTLGWLAAWLADPRALRAEARMPSLLHGAGAAQDAADLAAFLAARPEGAPAAESARGDAAVGGALFEDLGCIACHQLGDEPAKPGRVPIDLRGAGAKFAPGALAAFLRAPRAHDAWSRMPDFALTAAEAADLEAFVRARGAAALAAPPRGDAARGSTLFASLRCAACHELAGSAPVPSAAPLGSEPVPSAAPLGSEPVPSAAPLAEVLAGDLARGCAATSDDARGTAPDFRLTASELDALRAFAAAGIDALARTTPMETAARQIEEQRCTACHALDGRDDDWTARLRRLAALGLGDEEVPQLRPDLTFAGEKLRAAWLADFLAGRRERPARPWLRARMPSFPAVAQDLARGLAAMHGRGFAEPEEPAPDQALSAIGQNLIGTDGGFGCVVCHGVAGAPPLAVFEVQGIDLALAGQRLRPDWFARWMWDPPRIDASARMPRYADDQGKTAFGDVLGGDARAQFEAIWAHLRSLR